MRAPRFRACSSSSSTKTPPPSPMTRPSRPRSNGRHAFSGASLRLRQRLEQALADQAQRVDLALGAADQEEVGRVAAEDAVRLAQGQQAGHVALGDAVVRPLGVVQDRDVAGQHVRQVLEHPQRLDGRQALLAPLLQIDVAGLAVDADLRRRRPARAARWRSGRRRTRRRSASGRASLLSTLPVVERQLGGGDGELDGAGHHLAGSCAPSSRRSSWRRSRGSRRRSATGRAEASNAWIGRTPLLPSSRRVPEGVRGRGRAA